MRYYNFSTPRPYTLIPILLAGTVIIVLGFFFFVIAAAIAAAVIIGTSLYRLFFANTVRKSTGRVEASTDPSTDDGFTEYKLVESIPHDKKE
jgi:hypothetical protein